MRTTTTSIAILFALGAHGMEQNSSTPYAMTDTVTQMTDTIGTPNTSLNDIRFGNWDENDWLDNEYIRTLRKYLDDYNQHTVSNSTLDPYREQLKGQFVVFDINPYLLGGVIINIIFLNAPDNVFSCWVYSDVDKDKKTVENYEFRSLYKEKETTGLTQKDILQAIQEVKGLKLW